MLPSATALGLPAVVNSAMIARSTQP